MIVYSVEQAQPRRLEFQVPHSENHDFTYLTGLEGLNSLDSALLLLPTPDKQWAVLYTSADVQVIKTVTGIEDVRPYGRLEEDVSAGLTDYRDMRITQIRRWPLPAALAKAFGRHDKVPVSELPAVPPPGHARAAAAGVFDRFRRFSPELQLRDSAEILDPVRMFHDSYSLSSLRRAVQITGEGIVEGLRAVRPGMTEAQVMEIMDFVYRYRGAYLGFPTAVRKMSMTGRKETQQIPEGFIQFVPRSSATCSSRATWCTSTPARRSTIIPPTCSATSRGRQVHAGAAEAVRNRAQHSKDRDLANQAGRHLVGAAQPRRPDAEATQAGTTSTTPTASGTSSGWKCTTKGTTSSRCSPGWRSPSNRAWRLPMDRASRSRTM